MTLIPKVENLSSIEDLRPVSMVGNLYKVILKTLVRRLRSVLGDVISDNQSGFIHNRSILDGFLTTSETIHWLKRKKKGEALFKKDI